MKEWFSTYWPILIVPDWSNCIVEMTGPLAGKNDVPLTLGYKPTIVAGERPRAIPIGIIARTVAACEARNEEAKKQIIAKRSG